MMAASWSDSAYSRQRHVQAGLERDAETATTRAQALAGTDEGAALAGEAWTLHRQADAIALALTGQVVQR